MSWDELSMAEKADVMKLAVGGGVYDLDAIRSGYNEFAKGGKIHIAPSKRGTFTAAASKHGKSVQAFASQVLAHPENYSPAMRKKANFARNASKWKHEDGGNLFDGNSQPSQQMQIGRPFWQSQTQEPTFMKSLAEFNRQQEIKKQQQRQALREKKINTVGRKLVEERIREAFVESNDNAWVETPLLTRKKNSHLSRRSEEGAKAHAAWEMEHPNFTAWSYLPSAAVIGTALAPLGAAGWSGLTALGDAAAATSAGQAITSALAPVVTAATTTLPYVNTSLANLGNAGLTSWFGTEGINRAIEEKGISPMTALDLAPMLQVAKPIYKGAATAVENYRYPLGRPTIPEGFSEVVPNIRTKLGDVEINNPNLYYRQGSKEIVDDYLSTGTVRGVDSRSIWGDNYANNPMFQKGSLFYNNQKPGLLVSNGKMNYADVLSRPITEEAALRGGEELNWGIPAESLNPSNTVAYRLEPNYGYRRVFAEETPAAEWAMGRTAHKITDEGGINSEILQNAFENQPRSIGDIIRRMKEPESMLTPEQNARISKYANNPKDPSIQMDERLAAGGADRLMADDRVVYHDYPAVITEYVPTDNRTFLPQVQEAIKQAQNTYGRRLTNEEIIEIADEISAGKSFAIKDTPYGFVKETLPRVRRGIEKGHEKSHIKVSPKTYSSPLPKDFLEAKWGKDNYMVKNNGDEQLPRLSQIKAYYGKDEISAEELMYAAENYVKDTKVDNNMTDFFNAIKEYAKQHPEIWKEMAKYGSEAAPIGLLLLYLNKD